MVQEPTTPPDRAKTVHDNDQTSFIAYNANDDRQRGNQNNAGDAKSNIARVKMAIQQPPKPQPPPEPPPAPQRRPWPGTNSGISYSTRIHREDGADKYATREAANGTANPTRRCIFQDYLGP